MIELYLILQPLSTNLLANNASQRLFVVVMCCRSSQLKVWMQQTSQLSPLASGAPPAKTCILENSWCAMWCVRHGFSHAYAGLTALCCRRSTCMCWPQAHIMTYDMPWCTCIIYIYISTINTLHELHMLSFLHLESRETCWRMAWSPNASLHGDFSCRGLPQRVLSDARCSVAV